MRPPRLAVNIKGHLQAQRREICSACEIEFLVRCVGAVNSLSPLVEESGEADESLLGFPLSHYVAH